MNKAVKKLPTHLAPDELKKLISGTKKDRHRLGLAFMSYGGLRVSEMRTLKVKDINLARDFIRVNGKGGKERYVPLTSKLHNLIEKYLSKHGENLSPDSLILGKTRSSWHYVVKKYSQKILGRDDVHCHTLRHSFATALYSDGVQIERISELLGHARLDTTMIYSHISMTQKREAVMVLDGKRPRLISLIQTITRKRIELTVQNYSDLIGREHELGQINKYLDQGVSVILSGPKGSGKSTILKHISHALYIHEYKKKQSLIRIILDSRDLEGDVYKETEKLLKKLSIDELIDEIKDVNRVIVIDDITDLSKADRKIISKLAEKTTPARSLSSKKRLSG